MLSTACAKDGQARMVTASVECTVTSQGRTLNKQVHKYGYNFKLCLERSEHLARRENKSRLGGNDLHIDGGKNEKHGEGM